MNPASMLIRFLVRGYQLLVSPLLPGACRYYPTCSEYALQSVGRFGALKGGWLALRRLASCNPWGGSGFDPVPGDPIEGGNGHDHACTHTHIR